MPTEIDFEQLKNKAIKFRDDRNWKQFHSLKNLLIALNIEVGELQELFLWKSDKDIESQLENEVGKQKVKEEIADILIYLIYISEQYNINLLDAVNEKLNINEVKYPVEKSINSSKKYTEL